MNQQRKNSLNIDQIDTEIQDIMSELESLISEKYEKMDYEQKVVNTEAFLQFFDRFMEQNLQPCPPI
ncbi:hypothetical protein Sulku_1068 [Sulfuricurvum kujiense DSM 16994]|uniref:Uncharacterized protein n=1 Tax=Sulfuricurvum kujiense (strain ATCC BAA-921 / DSM 16994 / JCM 11577 / YK-1) TaxID=709032 RepID=E4U361_SULKY|nr:hypothetical protein [Sulfuricurvum kujiense]ADR33731.1 hypothetical protein Sulku_1068 [Sulfuricurvum kujiense DSM 16994]